MLKEIKTQVFVCDKCGKPSNYQGCCEICGFDNYCTSCLTTIRSGEFCDGSEQEIDICDDCKTAISHQKNNDYCTLMEMRRALQEKISELRVQDYELAKQLKKILKDMQKCHSS